MLFPHNSTKYNESITYLNITNYKECDKVKSNSNPAKLQTLSAAFKSINFSHTFSGFKFSM